MDTHAGWFLENVWIIPLVAAVSFLAILFFGKRLPERATAGIGILAVAVCLVLSGGVAVQWIDRTNHPPEAGHATGGGGHGGVEEDPGGHGEGALGPGEHAAPSLAAAEKGESHASVPPVVREVTWFQIGGIEFKAGTLADGLTAMSTSTATCGSRTTTPSSACSRRRCCSTSSARTPCRCSWDGSWSASARSR
jgi:NADH-quinone oxidoreductase subunit L